MNKRPIDFFIIGENPSGHELMLRRIIEVLTQEKTVLNVYRFSNRLNIDGLEIKNGKLFDFIRSIRKDRNTVIVSGSPYAGIIYRLYCFIFIKQVWEYVPFDENIVTRDRVWHILLALINKKIIKRRIICIKQGKSWIENTFVINNIYGK